VPRNSQADQDIIAGLGARTPTGLKADASAIAVYAGISGIVEHPYMVDKAGDSFMVGIDQTLEEHDRNERMYFLAKSALEEVIKTMPLSPEIRLSVYLGLPELGTHFDQRAVDTLCQRLTVHLSATCRPVLRPVPEGNAAFILALQHALNDMRRGIVDQCIVGGVDSLLDPDILEPMDEAGRIASASNRWGCPPGEGAAMLAVCNASFARQNSLSPLASIASIGISHEPNQINSDTICTGEGLAKAMIEANNGVEEQITKQYCDINGERYREDEFSYAILRVPSSTFVNAIDYVAPADCWGHTGAATAALLALLPVSCSRRGFVTGNWPMIWCGSESGLRAAMILHIFERETKW
jgi:3-oxoacyl-[acyl-carrier-protein] synthase-1